MAGRVRLVILVPSTDYQASAGARIRYGRLAHGLALVGVDLRLESIGQFNPGSAEYDVLVISKCHDARAIIAASAAAERGKRVGVDLFDDYFSQITDSRLCGYREWLARLLEECDFCLCSTETLAAVVKTYKSDVPTMVVHDPARVHEIETVEKLVDKKYTLARRQSKIKATWFGVGDNPYFPVGLTDLFAHASILRELADSGLDVELTVLTNRRSLGPDGLEKLSKLPVQHAVLEWSEKSEREVLEDSLLAFLPVANQPFSAAKSLNRAFTALSYGCQILSVGHPLYKGLDPLIYRDLTTFLSDFWSDDLRLSAPNIHIYQEKLHELGSAAVESFRLNEFIRGLPSVPTRNFGKLCVVHGLATRAEVHHLTQALGGLSIASPYCFANLEFDLVFRGVPPKMTMALSKPSFGTRRNVFTNQSEGLAANQLEAPLFPLASQLATYSASMREICFQLEKAFGDIRFIVSETSRIPVSASLET